MKIAICGSAPSSVRLAPYGDPQWQIWGCSPGLYPLAGRIDEWFELHRYEPPVLGRLDQQVAWFSPEYCGWMIMQRLVWMFKQQDGIPGSKTFPWEPMVKKYGPYFFNSSISWMLAFAIDRIELNRKHTVEPTTTEHMIGLWGVDMAAGEEYGYQRAGCQYFVLLARSLGITVYLPPESDLMRPPALYGIDEHLHRRVKWAARRKELELHKKVSAGNLEQAKHQDAYLQGALDNQTYMENNWGSNQSQEQTPESVLKPRTIIEMEDEIIAAAKDNSTGLPLRVIMGAHEEEAPTGTAG